jgi:hypothetical protein
LARAKAAAASVGERPGAVQFAAENRRRHEIHLGFARAATTTVTRILYDRQSAGVTSWVSQS